MLNAKFFGCYFQDEQNGGESDDADDMPEVQETVSVVPGSTLLWRVDPRPAYSAEVEQYRNTKT